MSVSQGAGTRKRTRDGTRGATFGLSSARQAQRATARSLRRRFGTQARLRCGAQPLRTRHDLFASALAPLRVARNRGARTVRATSRSCARPLWVSRFPKASAGRLAKCRASASRAREAAEAPQRRSSDDRLEAHPGATDANDAVGVADQRRKAPHGGRSSTTAVELTSRYGERQIHHAEAARISSRSCAQPYPMPSMGSDP